MQQTFICESVQSRDGTQLVCTPSSRQNHHPRKPKSRSRARHRFGSQSDCYDSYGVDIRSKGYWKNHPSDPAWDLLEDCSTNEFESESADWQFIDPKADSAYTILNGILYIDVPQGDHDPYPSFVAPRYVRDTSKLADVNNFEVETKMLSVMDKKYQIQGIAIEQDPLNYIRFEFFHDGIKTHVYVQSTIGGVYQSFVNDIPFGSGSSPVPIWMRVKRAGNLWTCKYSTDGSNFTSTASMNMPLNLQNIGVYAGNAVGPSSPAHIAQFEYFRDVNCQSLGTSTPFFSTGMTWIQVLRYKSGRDVYYKLAKQYIAAVLNILSGVDEGNIGPVLDEAQILLSQYFPGHLPDRRRALELKDLLEKFNHC